MDALAGEMAAIAVGQLGLVTLGQLRELKVTRHQRERLLATKQIVRVAHDVYRLGGVPFTWQARIAAAQLALGSDAFASHRSAAALYGLDGFDQQRVIDSASRPNDRLGNPRTSGSIGASTTTS